MPSNTKLRAIYKGQTSWCRVSPVQTKTHSTGEDTVITLPTTVKEQLLADSTTISESVVDKADSIIKGIQNEAVSSLFGRKAMAVAQTPFRLIKRVTAPADSQCESAANSFIALSYCWHNQEWASKADLGNSFSQIPISPILYEALMDERVSQDEGIWIDQLCINQSDPDEKVLAIGSMDVIYRHSRLVGVVLEDILLDAVDTEAIRILGEIFDRGDYFFYTDNLVLARELTTVLWKIFSARWFTRAWCEHELLMSNNQLFLIRSSTMQNGAPVVIKMTSEFLYDLAILAKGITSFIDANEFAASESTYALPLSRFYVFATQRFNPSWLTTTASAENRFIPSYMRVFRRIFAYEASVVTDKLCISLNVLQCGLFFKGPLLMNRDQCCYIFYHVALSAGDATTLSLCGKRLQQATWMRWPSRGDIIESYSTSSRHMRLPETPDFNEEAIELDMIEIGSSQTLKRATSAHQTWAERIIQKCIDLADEFSDKGSPFLEEVWPRTHNDASARRCFYAELLACMRDCGIQWLLQSWKQKDEGLYEDDYELSIERLFSLDCKSVDSLAYEDADDLVVILYLLDGLVGAWLPETPDEQWAPAWLQMSNGLAGRQLILCPSNEEYLVSIPKVLLSAHYGFQKRIWFLKQKASCKGGKIDWEIVGKTCSFGPVDLECLGEVSTATGSYRICG
ncbi:heterokaryon incompatibility domain-containing protein [Trichoderma chlorosporum]